MMIGDFLKSSAVKRALSVGQDQVGKVVGQLLASERFMHGVQAVVASALTAKSTFDRGVKSALQTVNLPTSADVEELKRKLAELESALDGLAQRLATPPEAAPKRSAPREDA